MATRIKNFFLGISLFVVTLVSWQILSAFQIVPPWLLPTPGETILAFSELARSGILLTLLFNSFLNMFPPFILALATSITFGIFIGVHITFRRMCLPFLAAINSVPSLAWLPLLIIFFGFTRQTIWAVIFISSSIKMIYNVIGGVRGINHNWLLVARNFELSKFETIKKVILPGALPQILSGVRLGFGAAWRSLIGAEMLVVTAGGIGKYIWMSQWAFKLDQVISGIVVIAFVGVFAEQIIFNKIEQVTLTKWGLIHE
jgi:sulfonate transport system permease protein